jgi:hypothetical protein
MESRVKASLTRQAEEGEAFGYQLLENWLFVIGAIRMRNSECGSRNGERELVANRFYLAD